MDKMDKNMKLVFVNINCCNLSCWVVLIFYYIKVFERKVLVLDLYCINIVYWYFMINLCLI